MKSRSTNRLNYQNLELRQLLAGITFDAGSGVVTILGSAFDDVAAVGYDASGDVFVALAGFGQNTFAGTLRGILASLGLPQVLLPVFLGLFDGVIDLGNGGPGAVLGSAADAFSYGLVEVFEDAGAPRLRYTARGNPDYAAGANDPSDVVDLFSFEMP